ncbi:VOC family protein [Prauserella oleivorans]|uniref:VOC family protein n=1 Tax=Prauserella oleivorans TaxID=1478153 RepID=A0ABW5WG41_9PSEU
MARLARVHHLALTVTDVDRSVPWYVRVLGFEVAARSEDVEFGLRRVELHAPGDGFSVVLVEHAYAERPPFNERHTGLDHVAFAVASCAELGRWERKLADHGVGYNAVERPPGRTVVVFRDPDGIQLEILADTTDPA